MGKIELDHTGAGSGVTLSSDGTDLLLNGTAIGGLPELYAENYVSGTLPIATGTDAFVIGRNSTASGERSVALGAYSTASGSYSFAVNGSTASGTNSVGILGSATQNGATAVGSNSGLLIAQAAGQGAVSLGGSYASGTDSFAAAIASASSSYGATGANSVAMGRLNSASASKSISIGDSNFSSGTSSLVLGTNCSASSDYAFAAGYFSHTKSNYGKQVWASGRFSGTGDAQTGTFVLRSDTTDATPEALTTNNSTASTTNQIILPNNSAYAFHGTIVAREQASAGTDCAAWKIEGLIRREGSAGTTVLVNSATTVIDNTPSWGLALSADTTNGGLKIEVTGAAATNIRWVATVHTSEVTY